MSTIVYRYCFCFAGLLWASPYSRTDDPMDRAKCLGPGFASDARLVECYLSTLDDIRTDEFCQKYPHYKQYLLKSLTSLAYRVATRLQDETSNAVLWLS